jgi:hypothetical protein
MDITVAAVLGALVFCGNCYWRRVMNREGAKGMSFRGVTKDGFSFAFIRKNRMLNGNASELALQCMRSGMPEWDWKELQNRVRENLAWTIK